MKHKLIFGFLISALCFGLTSCVSQEQYSQLESRVAALEESNNAVETINSIETTSNTVEDLIIDPVDTSETTTAIDNTNYDLTGMTADEIYAECQSIWTIIPTTAGLTVDDYYTVLKYNPVASYIPGIFPHWVFAGRDNFEIVNCITQIQVQGLTEEMDNTVGCSDGDSGLWIWTTITIHTNNYDIAAQLYDLHVNSGWDLIYNQQEGTYWYAQAKNPADQFMVAYMEKNTDNTYTVALTNIAI